MGKEIAVKGMIVLFLWMLILSFVTYAITINKIEQQQSLLPNYEDTDIIYSENGVPLTANTDYNESFFENQDRLDEITAKKSTSVVREMWNTVKVQNVDVQSTSQDFNKFWNFIKILFVWFPGVLFVICLLYSLPFF